MTTSRPPRKSAYSEKVTTGRTMLRPWQRCQGCNARLTIGEPKASDDSAWWQRLRLSEEQRDLLLLAAAEFTELSEACYRCYHKPHGGMCRDPEGWNSICRCTDYVPCYEPDPVSFVDWLSPSVLESLHYRKPA